jgi:hypothetical protein
LPRRLCIIFKKTEKKRPNKRTVQVVLLLLIIIYVLQEIDCSNSWVLIMNILPSYFKGKGHNISPLAKFVCAVR